jgi:hypothetical protein
MRGRLHERTGDVELADRQPECDVAALLVDDREVLSVLGLEPVVGRHADQGDDRAGGHRDSAQTSAPGHKHSTRLC